MQAVSSGGIVSIFGSAFAVAGSFRQVGPEDIVNDRLPTSLGGVCVLFGNERAFILHVLANQLNVQASALQADQTVEVQVARKGEIPVPGQLVQTSARPVVTTRHSEVRISCVPVSRQLNHDGLGADGDRCGVRLCSLARGAGDDGEIAGSVAAEVDGFRRAV